MPNTFDAVVKDLVSRHPHDWVRFVGWAADAPAETVPADLSVVSAAADALVRSGGLLLHVEFQTGPDEQLAERVLLYNVLAHRQTRLPVHSLVFLLQPNTGRVADRVDYSADPSRGGLAFRFEVVRVWEQPAERFLDGPFALMPLAMLSEPPAGQTRAEMLPGVIGRIDARVRAEAPEQRSHMTLAALLLGGLRFDKRLLIDIYRRVPGMENNTAIQMFEEFGEIRAIRRAVTALGRERFGPPTAEQTDRLNRIEDLDRLNRLVVRVLKVDSWDALLRGR